MANELYIYGKGSVKLSSSGISDYTAYGLPVLYLEGDVDSVTKDDRVNFDFVYGEYSGTCQLKWQGNSSIGYPKKNYTMSKISMPFEAKEGWDAQNKYCLKANYIDFSHGRNIILANRWAAIVGGRTDIPTKMVESPNYCAMDGFPIVMMMNGEFFGMYTMNIPKDPWAFNIDTEIDTTAYVVCAEAHSDAASMTGLAVCDGTDFTMEVLPDADADDVTNGCTSLNRAIQAVIDFDGSDWSTIEQYIDIQSAIDYYIFVVLTTDMDGLDKNYLLITYDGIKWYFSAYDLDSTIGNYWTGSRYYSYTASPLFEHAAGAHRLFELLWTYRKDEVITRAGKIINSYMSKNIMMEVFGRWCAGIPRAIKNADCEKWGTIPGTDTSDFHQICDYYNTRLDYIQSMYGIK